LLFVVTIVVMKLTEPEVIVVVLSGVGAPAVGMFTKTMFVG
jgi:hypothetical protein